MIWLMKTHINNSNRLGIDIGRVIMAPVTGGKADTSFLSGGLEQALSTPPSPGAIESVKQLVKAFGGRVWLVSKAGPNVQRKTWLWFEHHDFYRRTGMVPAHVRFCFKREEKAIHCEELKITHFIDDRLDVLDYVKAHVRHRYLFGEQPEEITIPGDVCAVIDWSTATDKILETLA